MTEQLYSEMNPNDVQKDFAPGRVVWHVCDFTIGRVRIDVEGDGHVHSVRKMNVFGVDGYCNDEFFSVAREELYGTGAEAIQAVLAFYDREKQRLHDEAMACIRKVVGG